jgi:DNA-binding MarR family transcriptional regulator
MPPPEEPAGLGAWRAFLLTHAAVVRRLERILEQDQHLPLAWYDVLLELNAAPERRLRMQDLAARVVLSRSRVSRVVDEMARAGLVRREPDPADGRAAFAVVTDEGRNALRRAAPVYLQGIEDEFLAHLTAEEAATIEGALGRVLDAQRTLDAREAPRSA